jgi:L-asparaginase II
VTVHTYALLAEVDRSGFTESRHFGSLVGLDPGGGVVLALGDVRAPVLPRSTSKPLQATGCLRAGAPLAGERLAIAAGSHTGEERHVETVLRVLADAGLTADALQCPAAWPEDEATRDSLIRAGEREVRVRHNCSGKHAAMLSACVANGWSTEDYLDPAHPVQAAIRATMEQLAGERVAHVAVDGCGAPTLALTLTGLARAMRHLALAAGDAPEAAVAAAMRAHPEFVGGTGHINTELMQALPGTIAKGGAEGVLAVATADGHAVAMKIIDGSARACTPIALHALAALGVDVAGARHLATLPVLGGGRPVGSIRASFSD